ncbi:MAG: hypothetical protein AAB439_02990 [Patescibacteria group bacterium]
MSLWLILAVSAQLLSALTVFIDKFILVSKEGIKSPAAFAFYTAMLSGSVIVLLPFGVVTTPTYQILFFSTISALIYIVSLLFLYRALQELTVTDVIPVTASAGALTTGTLAALLLTKDIPLSFLPAFLLLSVGTFLIYCFCFSRKLFLMTVVAGILLGTSSFIAKLVFDAADTFFSGLFWLLIMNAIVALITLAPARFFAIRDSLKGSSSGAKYLAVLSKALGGAAFFLSAVAISLGSVSIVNALGGLQLVFLFILTPLFVHRMPDVFKYELTKESLTLKLLGTIAIVAGLAILFAFQ